MNYVIYLLSNGEILRPFSGPPGDLQHQLRAGEAAVEGSGSWHTHKVVEGEVVALAEPRVAPFEGAWWDCVSAVWFDPLQRTETADVGRTQRYAFLIGKISHAELRQARPMREIQMAQAQGHAVPGAALVALESIELEITQLREQLAALA